ncbi:MAG: S9 family peptidase [Bacteroidales bacterium]|nr:S9 family peptidase [Bacteroidales bacterium]
MRKSFLIIWAIALAATFSTANAQEKKDIQLQDIWASGKFYPEMLRGVNPMADGETYLVDEDTALNVFNYKTGKFVKTLVNQNALMVQGKNKPLSFGNFSLSKDETKLLIPTETESIYRHSTKSNYFVYDLKTKAIIALSENGKQSLADFSPDGVKIAFVRDNNLFIKDLTNLTETQLTFDGKHTEIINGTTDWVYEEEFGFTKAFFWSPDSKKIAFYRFDESRVKEFQLEYFQGLYPEWYTYKYPKAGEDNSLIAIKVYDLQQKSTDDIPLGTETDIYIPRIKWTNSPNLLAIQRMNRLQNRLEILLADVSLKKTSLVYEENNTYYIDITDNLNFLNDNKHFIITSEKDGFNHIYLYDLSGIQVNQLTKGNWDVTEVYGVDSKGKTVYFQSAETGPLDRQVYSVDMKGNKKALTNIPGTNDAGFSSSYAYFINTNTTANTPHLIQAFTGSGKFLRTIIDNTDYLTMLSGFNLSQQEFFTINDPAIILPSGEAVSLNAWRIVPPDFDPAKKYPVLIYVYGGPGSQTVTNAWGWHNYFWFQMLAEKGIVVISVDNRGTGARGETFKKMTYKELGKYETEDMITTAKYLGGLDYVDKERIGIFGWSYGGYMSSLAITKGAEVFSSAIAVAPVTNWRNYDNIYTERFMQTPQVNASGYDDNSPVNHVKELKGSFLLVHGSADDNVHYQNTMDLINALVKANKQFELMIYPNRNHGIYGGTTRLHLYTLMNDFLDRNLLKQGE